MQPNQPDPYNFIMEPGQSKKSGLNFGNKKRSTIYGIIFVIIILLIVWVVVSIIKSSGGESTKSLINVKSYQIEINRVIELGQENVSDPALVEQIATLQAVVTSDSVGVTGAISKSGVKPTPLQLTAQKDSKVEEELQTALTTGKLDDELGKRLNELSKDYFTSIQIAKTQTTTKSTSDVLKRAQDNIETIYPES